MGCIVSNFYIYKAPKRENGCSEEMRGLSWEERG